MNPKQATSQQAPKKKGFKMPDIYIILGLFILLMAVLTYVVPAGQYDRQVVETAHGVQNLVVANTYHAVAQNPAGWLEIITAIPFGFERAAGIVVLTFMVGACMGLIKRAGLIDLGVQRLSRAVGQSEFLVAPVLMIVLSMLAAFIGVPELSLAYLPVFLPLFYRLGYDGMTATAVALLSPCIGFTFGITIPGSVGMGQQIAQITMFSGSALRAVVLVIAVAVTIAYVMLYASRVKKDPKKSLTYDTDLELVQHLCFLDVGRSQCGRLHFCRHALLSGSGRLAGLCFPYRRHCHHSGTCQHHWRPEPEACRAVPGDFAHDVRRLRCEHSGSHPRRHCRRLVWHPDLSRERRAHDRRSLRVA